MKQINFALIGAGDIARRHIAAINLCKYSNLVGILSLSGKNNNIFLKNNSFARAYKTLEEVLKDKSVEAVDIIAKHDLHSKLGIAAANYGKHILIEKPIATNVKDAERLVKICNKNKVLLSVVYQNRFSNKYIKLKQKINSGELGKIDLAVFSWNISKKFDYFFSSPWRGKKKESGGGFMMMNAIHYIDLLQWLMGPVKCVHGNIYKSKNKTEVEDTGYAFIEFKNNSKAIIYGTTAALSNAPPTLEFYSKGRYIKIIDNEFIGNSTYLLEKQIENFVSAIVYGRAPLIDGPEAIKSLKIISAIYKSAKVKNFH